MKKSLAIAITAAIAMASTAIAQDPKVAVTPATARTTERVPPQARVVQCQGGQTQRHSNA